MSPLRDKIRRNVMARNWRIAASFHRVGEVAVIVTAPNWQGALRKGALAIKALPQLAGRRINVGSFTLQEYQGPAPAAPATQAAFASEPEPAAAGQESEALPLAQEPEPES